MTHSPKIMHLWKTIFNKLIIPLIILCSYSHAARAQMSGTYTIAPSGGHYTSIADAVTALGSAGMSGAVVLELAASYAGESYPISLMAIGAASSTNTITICPTSGVVSALSMAATFTSLQC